MPFDPKAYLAQNHAPEQKPSGGFDPKAYLSGDSAAPKSDDSTLKQIDQMNESGDTSNDALFNMLSFGHLPQIKAKAQQIFSGGGIANDDNYVKLRDAEIKAEKDREEKYPWAHREGTVAGAIAPMLVTGGAGAAPSMGKAIDSSARLGLMYGLAQNPGDKEGVVDPVQFDDRAKNGIVGSAIGAAAPAAVSGVINSPRAAAWAGKKAISTFLGPSEEAIDRYMAEPGQIRSAPKVEDIKTRMDQVVSKLQSEVDAGRMSREQAHAALKSVDENIRQVRTEATNEFGRQSFMAGQNLDAAESAAGQKAKEITAGIRQDATIPDHVAHDIYDAVFKLKQQVGDGSKAAQEILEKTPGKINFHQDWKTLGEVRDSLNILGEARTPQAKATQGALENLSQMMGTLPPQLDLPSAKKVMMQLDAMGSALYNSPEFDTKLGQAVKSLRYGIDQQVKDQVPAYREAMGGVAENMNLLTKMQERFGSPQSAIGRLKGIHRPEARLDRADLSALSSSTGGDFLPAIDRAVEAQGKLANRDLMQSLVAQTPEHQTLLEKQTRMARLQTPDARRDFVNGAVEAGGLHANREAAQNGVAATEQALQAAQDKLEPYKGFSPNSTQSKIQSMMRGPKAQPIETRNTISKMDNEFGTSFGSDIDSRRIADQFEKGNTNGSRNAVIGGTVGGTVGGVIGGAPGAAIGLSAGSLAGGVIDKNGPQIARRVLDGALSAKDVPVVQFLMKSPRFAEMAEKNPAAFQLMVNSFSGRGNQSAAKNELDKSSSTPAQYPVAPEAAKKSFIEGN